MAIRRVGVLTSAIALISVGVVMVLHATSGVSYGTLRYLWPVFLILFGLEIIFVYTASREKHIRFSGVAVTVLILVIVMSFGESGLSVWAVNFGAGYSEPVKGAVPINHSIRQVVIEVPNTPVTVTGTRDAAVRYRGTIDVTASSRQLATSALRREWSVRREGSTLVLRQAKPGVEVNLSFGIFGAGSHLDVEVPKDVSCRVITSNAGVSVSHIQSSVIINTTNSRVKVQDVSKDVSVATTNGSIDLNHLGGTVMAKTSNASIDGNSTVDGGWTCTTTNGGIHLQLTGHPNAKIFAATTNGQIGGNVAWSMEQSNRATSVLGNGRNPLSLRTTNASIKVDAST